MDRGMKLALEKLAHELANSIIAREDGYCLRLDHLDVYSASFVCSHIHKLVGKNRAYLLVQKAHEHLVESEVNSERAIELRNRKPAAFVLLVPSGVVDSTASSLQNAFAAFDLDGFWRETVKNSLEVMDIEIRQIAGEVIRRSTLPGCSNEDRAIYCLTLVDSVNPRETVLHECYRVGLIPSKDLNIIDLDKNAAAAKAISRPLRSHSSLADRLDQIGVQHGQQRHALEDFLGAYQLSNWREWMQAIAHSGQALLQFSSWDLGIRGQSNLRRLHFVPWLDSHGKVESWSKLQQGELGTQPYIYVTGETEVQVRWESEPKIPKGIEKWQLELIPSEDFYSSIDTPDIDFPTKKVKGTLNRTTFKLGNLDLPEDGSSIVVQLRLTGVAETGGPLLNEENTVAIALSDEFQIRRLDFVNDVAGASSNASNATARDLPLAMLKLAVDSNESNFVPSSHFWSNSKLNIFNLAFQQGSKLRISLTPMLMQIEDLALNSPESLGCWTADAAFGSEIVLPEFSKASGVLSLEGEKFRSARLEFFRELRSQGPRRWLSVAEWTSTLMEAAEHYVDSYLDWLKSECPTERFQAIAIDTGVLHIRVDGGIVDAAITSPLHPLRVAWFQKYSSLLDSWREEIVRRKIQADSQEKQLDLTSIELIEPTGFPLVCLAPDNKIRLTSGCIDLLWTIALPPETRDPANTLSVVRQVIGASSSLSGSSKSLIARCVGHVQNYLRLHPVSHQLSVLSDNAGDGTLVGQVLTDAIESSKESESEANENGISSIDSIEITNHYKERLPASLPGLTPLRATSEQAGARRRSTIFRPLLETSIRSREDATREKSRGFNIAILMDITFSQINFESVKEERGSSALYGLLTPVQLLRGGPPWKYSICKTGDDDDLSPILEQHQAAIAKFAMNANEDCVSLLPVLRVAIDGESSWLESIHDQADWVITLDRFVEPAWIESNAGMKYLLDYSPDISDGLSRRLFVSTGHREQAKLIVGETLRELGFDPSQDAVTRVLNRLRQVSGRLALSSTNSGSSQKEATALAIVLEKLELDGMLRETIVVPVDSHIEMFTPSRRRGRPEKNRRCDMLLVRYEEGAGLIFELLEVKGRTHNPSPDVFATICQQLESTQKLIHDLWCNEDRIDRALQLYRLRQILEYHLRRAHGFGTISDLELWSKRIGEAANGKLTIVTRMRGFVVCNAALPEKLNRRGIEIEIVGEFSPSSICIPETSDETREAAFSHSKPTTFNSEVRQTLSPTVTEQRRESPVMSDSPHLPELPTSILPKNKHPTDGIIDGKSRDEVSPCHDASPSGVAESPKPVLDDPPIRIRSPFAKNRNAIPIEPIQSEIGAIPDNDPPPSSRNAKVDFLSRPSYISPLHLKPIVIPDDEPVQDPNKSEVSRDNKESENEQVGIHNPSQDRLESNEEVSSEPSRLTVQPGVSGGIEVVLGDTFGRPVLWKPSVTGSPHLFVIGIPGQGKSVTTTRILCELARQEVPALVLDFHGEFANSSGRFFSLAHPTVLSAADGLPFSIMEPKLGRGPRSKESALELAEICQYVCGLGDIQRDAIYRAFERSYNQVQENQTPALSSVMELLEQDESEGTSKNVSARCRPLFEFGLFADDPSEAIAEQFQRSTVVDLHELKSEVLQLAAGAFTLRKLYRQMFSWGPAEKIRLAVVLDEAHRLAKDVTLPKIMKEGRKFGIAVVVASQDVRDFHEQVLSNAGTKVVFRVNYPDSRKVAGFVRSSSTDTLAKQIEMLNVGEAIVQTPEMSVSQVTAMRKVGG